ncbi:MAG: biotin--[Clostridia bacterium]|nr:biotin--[acetyl-CoA-carboxylase] ligase [Clostridia bacterium]MBR0536783.1 biotin--[acetyl-CoA-carboxylase] ligase [Clostridia bacterium]
MNRPDRTWMHVAQTGSTNDDMKRMLRSPDAPPCPVLVAGRQTGGRGRVGRSFYSPDGGLYFSAAYPLPADVPDPAPLTLLAGLAVCMELEADCGDDGFSIKWPNDLFLNGKKLGGILTELVSCPGGLCAVVGVGLNLSLDARQVPAALADTLTSLSIENKRIPPKEPLARAIIQRLDRFVYYENALYGNAAPFIARINARSFLAGKTVFADNAGTTVRGTVSGVSSDGALIVDTVDGPREIRYGEVKII